MTQNSAKYAEAPEVSKQEVLSNSETLDIIQPVTAPDVPYVWSIAEVTVIPRSPFELPKYFSERPQADIIEWSEILAAEFNLDIRWVNITACGHAAGATYLITGCYTEGTNFIEMSIRNDTPNRYIIDVVSHEIAHAVTYRKCGTVIPFTRFENINEAYSDNYLLGFNDIKSYPYDKGDVAKAALIDKGIC